MAQIENAQRLIDKLRRMSRDAEDASVVVGYTQSYAIYVHEDLKARHAPGKQAKYLEGPLRRFREELAAIIWTTVLKTKSLTKGLLIGGLRLLRESQAVVPVDTSALRASGYVALEKDAAAASMDAFNKSETIRRTAEAQRKLGKGFSHEKGGRKQKLGKGFSHERGGRKR